MEPSRTASAIGAAKDARHTGESADDTGGCDLADRTVAVGDVDVARGVDRDTLRAIEPSRTAGAIGAARDARQTGQRADDTGGRDLADRVV